MRPRYGDEVVYIILKSRRRRFKKKQRVPQTLKPSAASPSRNLRDQADEEEDAWHRGLIVQRLSDPGALGAMPSENPRAADGRRSEENQRNFAPEEWHVRRASGEKALNSQL